MLFRSPRPSVVRALLRARLETPKSKTLTPAGVLDGLANRATEDEVQGTIMDYYNFIAHTQLLTHAELGRTVELRRRRNV